MTATPTSVKTITAYKGFGRDLSCRDFQYEVGKTYEHDGEPVACQSGFHACLSPQDVWRYYPPSQSRFCLVELAGDTSADGDDSKIAAAKITITAELDLASYIQTAVEHTFKAAKLVKGAIARAEKKAASATGYQGAASATGDQGAASATGDQGAASATGYQGAASATGYQGAASATGDQGAASATGTQGAASATGYQGAAISVGPNGRVMGGQDGVSLHADEWNDDWSEKVSAASGIVGKDGIKPDTWYVCKGGKLVEVNDA
jgi:hypothetical protein